jgi:hypothetical protein
MSARRSNALALTFATLSSTLLYQSLALRLSFRFSRFLPPPTTIPLGAIQSCDCVVHLGDDSAYLSLRQVMPHESGSLRVAADIRCHPKMTIPHVVSLPNLANSS